LYLWLNTRKAIKYWTIFFKDFAKTFIIKCFWTYIPYGFWREKVALALL
jgi:hypothetical protein